MPYAHVATFSPPLGVVDAVSCEIAGQARKLDAAIRYAEGGRRTPRRSACSHLYVRKPSATRGRKQKEGRGLERYRHAFPALPTPECSDQRISYPQLTTQLSRVAKPNLVSLSLGWQRRWQ